MDYKHELNLQDRSNKLDQNADQSKHDICNPSNQEVDLALMDKIIALQNTKTGSKLIDWMNAAVRPQTMYFMFTCYFAIKCAFIYWIFHTSATFVLTDVWTKDDMSLLTGMASFFYVGRVLGK
jgi:hypothetical protein